MAGIGFSLKRLFKKKGILNLCRAYGYAGIITTGPMILGVILLFGMSFVARLGGLSSHDRELLNCMITYSLLASLTITSWFNMGVTRFISDSLYEGREERIIPSFFGSVMVQIVLCSLSYGVFLHFSGVSLLYQILCLWFSLTLIVVWMEMIYMSAVKDYKAIVLSFIIAVMLGFLLSLIFILLGDASIESLLFSVILAYGVLAIRYFKILLDYFPKSAGTAFSFLRYLEKYRALVFAGGFTNIGLFSHFIIMYMGPLGVQVQGLFYGAPQYDVPALVAFFSLLVTTVSFVTSVEVNFYPTYSNYYGLFNDRGAIKDIQLAEQEMRAVLRRELLYLGHKQFLVVLLFIVFVPPGFQKLMPGISALSLAVFRFLCVGYGTYALANSMMLILLYFEDYKGAFFGAFLFGFFNTLATILQVIFGEKDFFGMGFFIGAILFYVFSVLRLEWYTQKLPYHLLARQSLIPTKQRGLLTAISQKLEDRWESRILKEDVILSQKTDQELKKEGLR